jgi:hypothetical protein
VSAPVSEDDRANAQFAIAVELAASELYQAAIDAGAKGTAWSILVTQHSQYAQRVAGITGIPADRADDALYQARLAEFQGGRPANAAFDLENTLIATHAALLGQVTDRNVAGALASFVAMESMQAAYLAERSGRGDNFDALFTCTGTPLVRAETP